MISGIVGIVEARRNLTDYVRQIRTGAVRAVGIGRHRALEAVLIDPRAQASPQVVQHIAHLAAAHHGPELLTSEPSNPALGELIAWVWINSPDSATELVADILALSAATDESNRLTLSEICTKILDATPNATLPLALDLIATDIRRRFDTTGNYGSLL